MSFGVRIAFPRAARGIKSAGMRSACNGLLLAFLASAPWTGCGGTGRSFDGAVFRDGPIAFAVAPAPSTWKRIQVTDAAIAFRDAAHDASVLVNARCKKPDDGTPLVALTNHLLMGSTEREVVTETVEPFDHREALHTTMRAKWDGVPMRLDIFVLKKDGCVYDFVYLAAPAAFEAGAADFESFVRSFRTLPGSGVAG